MSNPIDRILSEIHVALKDARPGEVFNWIDENFDHAHRAAVNRFDFAITNAAGHDNYFKLIEIEAGIYRDTILKFYAEYRKTKSQDTTGDLFESLAMRQKEGRKK